MHTSLKVVESGRRKVSLLVYSLSSEIIRQIAETVQMLIKYRHQWQQSKQCVCVTNSSLQIPLLLQRNYRCSKGIVKDHTN